MRVRLPPCALSYEAYNKNTRISLYMPEAAIELSKAVQKECGFNKRVSDRLAEIILCLYSSTNRQKWEKKDGEGLRAFLDEEFTYTWKGFAV